MGNPESTDKVVNRTPRRFAQMLSDELKCLLQDAPHELSNRYTHAINDMDKQLYKNFPNRAEKLGSMKRRLQEYEYTDDDTFKNIVTAELLKMFSPREIEERIREQEIGISGRTSINRALNCELEGDILKLHIPIMFNDNPLEFASEFLTGLNKLGQLLQTNKFRHVRIIQGTSPLIYDHPDLIERVGFTITNPDIPLDVGTDREVHMAQAEITRDAFLELYGAKK